MMKVYIETYGCQMNEYDSLMMATILKTMGYTPTATPDDADILIINTCSVREKPEHKVFSAAGRLRKYKEKNGGKLIIAGCTAQQIGEGFINKMPFVDAVIGPHHTQKIDQIIRELEEKRHVVKTEFYDDPGERFRVKFSPPLVNGISAYVTIMEGCDNFCTYCIVPYVRGREISRPHTDIVEDIKHLVRAGIKDFTLLGQNVNSYGKKGADQWNFARLLEEVADIDGVYRLRFVTSHPKDMSEEVIKLFGRYQNIVPYLHLPLQSGSNRILKLMNRKYTIEHYLNIVEKLRETRPEIALTTDLIVGFPGETVDDFEATLKAVEKIRYDNFFSFKYSPRPFTKAASLPDRVPPEEAQRRLEILQELQKEITRRKNQEKVGTIQEVLVEGTSKKNKEELMGRTPCNRIVNFPGHSDLMGKIVKVKIVEAYQNSLRGELLKETEAV